MKMHYSFQAPHSLPSLFSISGLGLIVFGEVIEVWQKKKPASHFKHSGSAPGREVNYSDSIENHKAFRARYRISLIFSLKC